MMDGKPLRLRSTTEAIRSGISCIYQELSIVPQLDIARNLFLGNMPLIGKTGIVDKKRLYSRSAEILRDYIGLDMPPQKPAGELSVAQQQMVEIGRAITRNARLIIMDEPTASLSDNETAVLFKLIDMLRRDGIAIIYISHKLEEVLAVSDRITVMRDGKKITTVLPAEIDKAKLISFMLGRKLENMYNKRPVQPGNVVMRVENLSSSKFEDISFEVRQGEILGFFGLVGAGRTEIMRAIFGVDGYTGGKVEILGQRLKKRRPHLSVKKGLAFATEDRKSEGLMLRLSILVNITLVRLGRLAKWGVMRPRAMREYAVKYGTAMKLKTPTISQLAGNLSGGNQQKVVLGKWMMNDPKVLILDEPTRGIDVGSKAEIYSLIGDMAAEGVSVIIVSSELEEILGMCDRVNVISGGKLTGSFKVDDVTSQQVLTAAFGGDAE